MRGVPAEGLVEDAEVVFVDPELLGCGELGLMREQCLLEGVGQEPWLWAFSADELGVQRPRLRPAVSFSPAVRRVSSFLAKWKRM